MKSTDLEALRLQAEQRPAGTVTIESADLLRLLSHIDELRTDLRNIDEFTQNSELEEESYSPTVWAWNNLLEEFRDVPRLYAGDLEVIQAPVIERLDIAETQIAAVHRLAQHAINRYNDHTMIKAKKVLEILDNAPD